MTQLLFNSYSPYPLKTLSNFYPVMFIYKGSSFKSSEHAYQAAKCILPEEVAKISKPFANFDQYDDPDTAEPIGVDYQGLALLHLAEFQRAYADHESRLTALENPEKSK